MNRKNTNVEHPIEPDEWGYLLLEDTPVELECREREQKNHSLRPNQWYTVDWRNTKEEEGVATGSNNSCYYNDSRPTQLYCPRCQFRVQVDRSDVKEKSLRLPARQSLFAELSSSTNAPLPLSRPCSKCGSPADGVVLQCIVQALPGQVQVVQSQILFLDDSLQRATFFVTLTFPTMGMDAQGRRTLVPHTAKPLSGPWQLLLSLLRSDWYMFDELYLALQDVRVTQGTRRNTRTEQQSLVPSRVTMPALYERLPASPPFAAALRRRRLDAALAVQASGGDHPQNHRVSWTHIEEVVWQRHIAPFLTAADVDALRRTCRYWHSGVLRRVVPGLRLALYQHQITSLAWMRQRERRTLVETDCDDMYHHQHAHEHGMDLHRAITAGATIQLRPRKTRNQWWRVDTLTGKEHPALRSSLSDGSTMPTAPRRRVARGGLLIDDPGLGKTITVLSLILQTAGLTTQVSSPSTDLSENFQEPDDDALFASYWHENVPDDFARHDLLKLVNQVDRRAPRGFWASSEMRRRIDSNVYASNFELFETDMRRGIMDHKGTEENDKRLALDLAEISQELAKDYKARMLVSAKKSFSNALAKPNSTLAYLIEESKRINFVKSLIPSRGTLIVIPSVLMDHWETQIDLYVDFKYLTKKLPLVYSFGGDGISLRAAQDLIRKGKFEPVVFLDKGGTKQLPPADFVAQFLIVVTTTSRLAQEWKNGSFQDELERCEDGTTERLYENSIDRAASDACPLLKIHWLRMIIDEGHSMAKAARSSSIQFASWISSERRWAMTGTPTKQGATALTQVKHLLSFLQHDFFSPRCDGETVWNRYIARPWNEGRNVDNGRDGGLNRLMTTIGPARAAGALAAFLRLRCLLLLLMKRHTKRDIAELPLPIEKEDFISLSDAEVKAYNSLTAVIASNLLLTSMKEDAVQDSLLHKSQARHARDALNNLIRVCAGFTKVLPTLSERNQIETLSLMDRYALEPHKEKVKQFMHRAVTDELTPCDCCGLDLSILLVLPCCGGLVCAECMEGQPSIQYINDHSEHWMHKPYDDKKRKQRKTRKYFQRECLLCESKIDVDNLQRLQPGMAFEWEDNIKGQKTKNADAETGTVLFLPNENKGPGPPQEVIVRPQIEERRRTMKPGDGHECAYDRFAINGRCIHCLEEHASCNLLYGRCSVCFRCPREVPIEETKIRYLVNKCLALMLEQSVHKDISRRDESHRPIKIIVFSALKKNLNLVGDRLLKRFGTACVAEYWGRYRTVELKKFVHDPECFCMLLGRDGSEGLDLSFVTHIFFLEEIFDKSLAAQTIARAWRMGAKGSVEVVTLIARNTIEETMKAYEEAKLAGPAQFSGGRKSEVVLKSLKFLTDYLQFRKNPLKRPPPKIESSVLPPVEKKRKVTFLV